jgi:hypothetical protein
MKFIIEVSRTPIYNRIAISITSTLRKLGHQVYFIDPIEFDNDAFVEIINNIAIDYYISTNDNNFINRFNSITGKFLIEEIQKNIIVIHHDSSFYKPSEIQETQNYLEALIRHTHRISHFFIESSNKVNFEKIGIRHCYEITHASEFTPSNIVANRSLQHGLSFVGHLMSNLNAYPADSLNANHHMFAMAWQRTAHATFPIQPQIWELLNDQSFKNSYGTDRYHNLATFQFLMHEVTKLSMAYRGELIGKINDFDVAVYGGDLSYGRSDNPLMKIKKENIHYLPATTDYQATQYIYQNTKININLTSLQFDTAINNRIIDIVMAGGFVITDKRPDLIKLCPTCNEVSFDSPEEMEFLIDYYMHPANLRRYNEVKNAVFYEIKDQFTYEQVITKMLRQLTA